MTEADDHRRPAPSLRVADSDRDAVAERLRSAMVDGRIDLAELDERLTAAYAAKTQAELDAVIADLPRQRQARSGTLNLRTDSGVLRKDGYWAVPPTITVECNAGQIVIDVTHAICGHEEVALHATISAGSVLVIVPHGWSVEIDAVTVAGGHVRNRVTGPPSPQTPTIRIGGEVRSGVLVARYPRRSLWSRLRGKDTAGERS